MEITTNYTSIDIMEKESAFSIPTCSKKKVKILFLAWGYSIHAKRRIDIFIEDPTFEVTVCSTYDYKFQNCNNVLLKEQLLIHKQKELKSVIKKSQIFSLIYKFTPNIVRKKIIVIKNYIMNKFFHEIKEFLVFFQHLYVLRKTYKKFKPDVIFLQTLLYPSYLAYFLPRITPVIITFWNGDILWWAQWNGIERKFKKQIVQYGIKRATTITVNSNSAYEICLNYGIDKKSVHVIRYPGIDLELFKEYDKEQCRKKIQVLTKHIVFWPRGIGSYLNFNTLLNAIPYVINQISDITFLVFPNNQLSINIIEKIESLGIESFIDFRNNVRFDEMPMYYSASDVMVSISSNDSQPNTMLEAMGCGCPVIMGDLPQIREWISEGSNGFIVDTDNPIALAGAIINVLTLDHEFLQKMKSQNRILIESKVDSKKMKEEIKRVVNSTVYGFESKNGHYNVT